MTNTPSEMHSSPTTLWLVILTFMLSNLPGGNKVLAYRECISKMFDSNRFKSCSTV